MRIAICDDDKIICDGLVARLSQRHSDRCVYKPIPFYSGDALWFEYQGGARPFDVIVMDIQMPGELDGLATARKIREAGDDVPIVLLTAYPQYALAGYQVRPVDYIVKQEADREKTYVKLFEVLDEVEARLVREWNDCLNLPVTGGFLRLPYDKILYLESKAHHALIHTDEETIKQCCKLSELLALCDERFLQPHKSYAVNADRIERIGSRYTEILLDNGKTIPISKQKKGDFVNGLLNYDRMCGSIQA